VFLAAAAFCLAVALVAFAGLILREDPVGRAIFGAAWIALAGVWLGRLAGITERPERGS